MRNVVIVDDNRINFSVGRKRFAMTVFVGGTFHIEEMKEGFLVGSESAATVQGTLKNLYKLTKYPIVIKTSK